MALVWNSIVDFGSICSSVVAGVCNFIGCQLDMLYLGWLTSVLYPAVLTIFILPFFILVFLYFSSLVLYIYTRRWRQVREVLQEGLNDPWAGGRYLISVLWDAHGYIWHGYDVQGAEHIPADKGALIVYYHGAIPVDVYYLVARFITSTGRHIHCVGDRFLQKIPGWNSILEAFDVSPSSVSECVRTVRAGHLMAISPGGVREAQFSDHSYSLLWGSRKGFAKVAIQANCPIIPMFTRNVREAFRVVTFPAALYSALYSRFKLPFAPIYGGFPVKLVSHLGPCVHPLPNESEEHLARRVERAVYRLISEHQRLPGNILAALLDRLHPKLAPSILGPGAGCLPDSVEASSDEEQTSAQDSCGLEHRSAEEGGSRSVSADGVHSQSDAATTSSLPGDCAKEVSSSLPCEDQFVSENLEERVASSSAVSESVEDNGSGLYARGNSSGKTRDITVTSGVSVGEFEASTLKEVLSSAAVRKRKKRRSQARSTVQENIDAGDNLILPSSLMENLPKEVWPKLPETEHPEVDVLAEQEVLQPDSESVHLKATKESVATSGSLGDSPDSTRGFSGLASKDVLEHAEPPLTEDKDREGEAEGSSSPALESPNVEDDSKTLEADAKRGTSSMNQTDEVVSDSCELSSVSYSPKITSKSNIPVLYSEEEESGGAFASPGSESIVQEFLPAPDLSAVTMQPLVEDAQGSSCIDDEQPLCLVPESRYPEVLESRDDHFSLRPEDMAAGEPSSSTAEIRGDLSFSENGKASLAAEVRGSERPTEKAASHTSSDSESSSASSFEMVDAKKTKS